MKLLERVQKRRKIYREEKIFNEEINDDFVEDAENTEEAVEDFDAEDIEE